MVNENRKPIAGISRRKAVRIMSTSAAGVLFPLHAAHAQSSGESSKMLSRAIPSSGEKLAVIGLGTWRAFDVGASEAEQPPLQDARTTFVKLGGRVVDSAAIYGRAEEVSCDIGTSLGLRNSLFFP